jgi:hypothetical protein
MELRNNINRINAASAAAALKKEEVELEEEHKVGDLVSYFHDRLGDHLYGKVASVEPDHITMKTAGQTWKVPKHLVLKADKNKVPKYRYEEVEHIDEIAMRRGEMSKSARIIKSIYNRNKVMEDTYDSEKADKSVQTYGKKPKLDTPNEKDNLREKKPTAAAVLSGGTTLTGQKRDTVEIDPAMRVRSGQPDPTKSKDVKKKDK